MCFFHTHVYGHDHSIFLALADGVRKPSQVEEMGFSYIYPSTAIIE